MLSIPTLFIFSGLVALSSTVSPVSVSAAHWIPNPSNRLQYQLGKSFDPSTDFISNIDIYAVDGFDTPKSSVDAIKAQGKRALCYISAGSSENWRSDFNRFLPADMGSNLDGWVGERWLNTNSDNVKAIMTDRVAMCKTKGFDGVDFDNVDGYSNANGLGLTAAQQITYNKFLAATAHAQGMAAILKNDVSQIVDLQPFFDASVNEQCWFYSECDTYVPFTNAGKLAFNVEYDGTAAAFTSTTCPEAIAAKMSSTLKTLKLDAYITQCEGAPVDPYAGTTRFVQDDGSVSTTPPPLSPSTTTTTTTTTNSTGSPTSSTGSGYGSPQTSLVVSESSGTTSSTAANDNNQNQQQQNAAGAGGGNGLTGGNGNAATDLQATLATSIVIATALIVAML